jgi:hypothetical protein
MANSLIVFIIIIQKASLMKTRISKYDHTLSVCSVVVKISYLQIIKGNSQHSILYSIVNQNETIAHFDETNKYGEQCF